MQNITGRDRHIIMKALALAIGAIDRAPPRQRPGFDRADMARLLEHMAPNDIELEMYLGSVLWTLDGEVNDQGN